MQNDSDPLFGEETRAILNAIGLENDDHAYRVALPKIGIIVSRYALIHGMTQGATKPDERYRFYQDLHTTACTLRDELSRACQPGLSLGRELTDATVLLSLSDTPDERDAAIRYMREGNRTGTPPKEDLTDAEWLAWGVSNRRAQRTLRDLLDRIIGLTEITEKARELMREGESVFDPKKRTKAQKANYWLLGQLAPLFHELTGQKPTAYKDRIEGIVSTPFVLFVDAVVEVLRVYIPMININPTFVADKLPNILRELHLD